MLLHELGASVTSASQGVRASCGVGQAASLRKCLSQLQVAVLRAGGAHAAVTDTLRGVIATGECTVRVFSLLDLTRRVRAGRDMLLALLRCLQDMMHTSCFGETVAAMATCSAEQLGEERYLRTREVQLATSIAATFLATTMMSSCAALSRST